MTRFIFIRHGNDNIKNISNNTEYHRNDPPISEEGKRSCIEFGNKLYKRYNIDAILCGPLERLRSTAKLIRGNNKTEIKINLYLSRYFTKKEKSDVSLFAGTKLYNINEQINESWREFEKRCLKFIKYLEKKFVNKTVVIITHCLVLKEVAKYYNIKLPDHQKFLFNFSIRNIKS